jgi:hypothetical protein
MGEQAPTRCSIMAGNTHQRVDASSTDVSSPALNPKDAT